jgi:hypothetical protein
VLGVGAAVRIRNVLDKLIQGRSPGTSQLCKYSNSWLQFDPAWFTCRCSPCQSHLPGHNAPAGEQVAIAAVGGSITAGGDKYNWLQQVYGWLQVRLSHALCS